jgi:hypothetical protein
MNWRKSMKLKFNFCTTFTTILLSVILLNALILKGEAEEPITKIYDFDARLEGKNGPLGFVVRALEDGKFYYLVPEKSTSEGVVPVVSKEQFQEIQNFFFNMSPEQLQKLQQSEDYITLQSGITLKVANAAGDLNKSAESLEYIRSIQDRTMNPDAPVLFQLREPTGESTQYLEIRSRGSYIFTFNSLAGTVKSVYWDFSKLPSKCTRSGSNEVTCPDLLPGVRSVESQSFLGVYAEESICKTTNGNLTSYGGPDMLQRIQKGPHASFFTCTKRTVIPYIEKVIKVK